MAELVIKFSNDSVVVGQILELQALNLRNNISSLESKDQGFVFVKHERFTLQSICDLEPAVVAFDNDSLAGYAICMNKKFGHQVPELTKLFKMIESILANITKENSINFLTCGQICVAKEYRGQNLMIRMYDKMKDLRNKYDFCVTEISSQNTRSLHQHQKMGWQIVKKYVKDDEEWNIVLWDWNNKIKPSIKV